MEVACYCAFAVLSDCLGCLSGYFASQFGYFVDSYCCIVRQLGYFVDSYYCLANQFGYLANQTGYLGIYFGYLGEY